jgi:hypothetical protein
VIFASFVSGMGRAGVLHGRVGGARQQIRAGPVVPVVAIGGRNQRPVSQTITQERLNPSASRSSWLLPRSDRPLANEPNHGGGHAPAGTDPL